MTVQSVLGSGEDPHLYKIKPRDATLAARATLCIENGWHLEGKDWMRTLAGNANKSLVTCVTGVPPLELEEEGGKGDEYEKHVFEKQNMIKPHPYSIDTS